MDSNSDKVDDSEPFLLKKRSKSQNIRINKTTDSSKCSQKDEILIHKPARKPEHILKNLQKPSSHTTSLKDDLSITSSRSIIPEVSPSSMATLTNEISEIRPEILEQKAKEKLEKEVLTHKPGEYHGIKAMETRVESREKMKIGPTRAPTHIRISTRFDYAPDICKDYYLTGFCGYGDNCKFVHDRGDYKSGWEIEKEWEEEQKKKAKKLRGEEVPEEPNYQIEFSDEEDDSFPLCCHICHGPYNDPVETKCHHFFCSDCAFDFYTKNNRCAVCCEPTQGIFNKARSLIKHLKNQENQKKERN